jgi:MFS family permease
MTYPDKPAGGWRGLFSPAHRAIAIIITASIALYSANVYMTSAVMPSVADDIGGLSLYAWVTGVFVLATVLGSTATATLLARLGTRRAYRLAMLVFGAGTALCAVAPSMPVLLVGRFVQGLGGGLLFGLAYSLVHLVLPERLWAYAMSLMSAAWGIGTFSGPALGGTFAEVDQWRLTFWILVPVVLFFTAWGGAGLPVGAGRSQRPAAAPLTSVALLGAAVLALSLAGVSTAPEVNAAGLAGAFVLLWAWLRHERSTDTRLFPASMFAPDARLRWLYATMALLVVGATPEVFLPYFAQRLQDLGPLAAGYLGTAMAAGWTAASVLLGAVTERREVLLRVAPAVSLAGLALLVRPARPEAMTRR